MSVSITCNLNTIAIPKENVNKIIDTINSKRSYNLIHKPEALFSYLWVSFEEHDDKYLIDFRENEHYESELEVLEEIAEFIEEGSFVEFVNEYGVLYRIVFKDKQMRYIYPRIEWDM